MWGALSETRLCADRNDCGGRQCFKGKCSGFAASNRRIWKCAVGERCSVNVNGWYDSDFKRYKLIVQSQKQCGTETENNSHFVETAICNAVDDYSCGADFGDARRDDVGRNRLCGCPQTDKPDACNLRVDYIIPIGWLDVNGFGLVANVFPEDSPLESRVAGSKYFPETYFPKTSAIHECFNGELCLLNGLRGWGLDTTSFVQAIPFDAECGSHPPSDFGFDAEGRQVDFWPCNPSGVHGTVCGIIPNISVYFGNSTSIPTDSYEASTFLKKWQLCGCSGIRTFNNSGRGEDNLLHCSHYSKFNVPLGRLIEFPGRSWLQSYRHRLFDIHDFYDPQFTRESYNNNSRNLALLPRPLPYTPPNIPFSSEGNHGSNSVDTGECSCFGKYSHCKNNICSGFAPDYAGDRVVENCVDSYTCTIRKGALKGSGITEEYAVMAIHPTSQCGMVPMLPDEAQFQNSHRWWCVPAADGKSCTFEAGVGTRLNTTEVEAMKLCGCPGVDLDLDGKVCADSREFFIPLGKLLLQQCVTNAHCIDKALAYCVFDHCAGPIGLLATAGISFVNCAIDGTKCTVKNLATKGLNEITKVIPVMADKHCGEFDEALDPDYIDANSLPCIIDVNQDGQCEVSASVLKLMGTTRLCGCSEVDRGGNGRACDEPEDFNFQYGLVSKGECNMDIDCKGPSICVHGSCEVDNWPPYMTSVEPASGSYAIPPLTQIVFHFNENVRINSEAKRRILIAHRETGHIWDVLVRDPRSFKFSDEHLLHTELDGRALTVKSHTPFSFPNGFYRVGFEAGIVLDLQDNTNDGNADLSFTVTDNGGCNIIYISGFPANQVNENINGKYDATEPINGYPSYTSVAVPDIGKRKPIHLYAVPASSMEPHHWIIDDDYTSNRFYAQLISTDVGESYDMSTPPRGHGPWYSYNATGSWVPNPDAYVVCAEVEDIRPPILMETVPSSGVTGVSPDANLTFIYDEPVNFGQWAYLEITPRGEGTKYMFSIDREKAGTHESIFMVEGSTLTIAHPQNFEMGKTYDLVTGFGLVTDLGYNPSPPLPVGALSFTVYGADCGEFPIGESGGLITNDKVTFHGAKLRLECPSGQSFGLQSSVTYLDAECVDGMWQWNQLKCLRDCLRLGVGREYNVTGVYEARLVHGTTLTLSCSVYSMPQSGHIVQNTTCLDGQWTRLDLKCGKSCGPFPSLGPNYIVTSDDYETSLGSKRLVTCVKGAVTESKGPKHVVCEEIGWGDLGFSCDIPCGTYPKKPGGYVVQSVRGTNRLFPKWDIKCDKGYSSSIKGVSAGMAECIDGKWVETVSLLCRKDCAPSEFGLGYIVEPVEGEPGSHGSSVAISCQKSAMLFSTDTQQTVRCSDGGWGVIKVICRAECGDPRYILGVAYFIESVPDSFNHGSEAVLSCAQNAIPWSGSIPDNIVCNDGLWTSVRKNGDLSVKKQPDLTCLSICGDFETSVPSGSRFVIEGRNTGNVEGASRLVRCEEGYRPTIGRKDSYQIYMCLNAVWVLQKSSEESKAAPRDNSTEELICGC